jgi:uncharacterized protein
MIERTIIQQLRYYVSKYPVVTLTGPRQSGKTTLLKYCFPDYNYVSFEDPDLLLMVKEDPRLFLRQYNDKTIIDEAQRFPELFSYLQAIVDKEGKEGMYILSGSQNFLLLEKISQSLAGRTAILKLLPFSYAEIRTYLPELPSIDSQIHTGGYPRIYEKNLKSKEFYPFYIQTYIERDVRQLQNIDDLNQFVKFVKLCAGRVGQLLNLSSIANDCAISQPTAKAWLSILEASFIVFLLKPYHRSFNKRLVKTPKLYFYDTGLVCSLLGINEYPQIINHYMRGELFENWVITEFLKKKFNEVEEPLVYFWRDNIGNEIDLIVEDGTGLNAYEIKSGSTYRQDYFKGLTYWKKLAPDINENTSVIYGGDKTMETVNGMLISWNDWC